MPIIILFQPEGVVTFNWTAGEQAYVLSSYFWGYAVTSFLSGTAAEMWGAKKVVFLTMLFSAILTIFTPQAAKWNFYLLFVTRLIIGLLSVSKIYINLLLYSATGICYGSEFKVVKYFLNL